MGGIVSCRFHTPIEVGAVPTPASSIDSCAGSIFESCHNCLMCRAWPVTGYKSTGCMSIGASSPLLVLCYLTANGPPVYISEVLR